MIADREHRLQFCIDIGQREFPAMDHEHFLGATMERQFPILQSSKVTSPPPAVRREAFPACFRFGPIAREDLLRALHLHLAGCALRENVTVVTDDAELHAGRAAAKPCSSIIGDRGRKRIGSIDEQTGFGRSVGCADDPGRCTVMRQKPSKMLHEFRNHGLSTEADLAQRAKIPTPIGRSRGRDDQLDHRVGQRQRCDLKVLDCIQY